MLIWCLRSPCVHSSKGQIFSKSDYLYWDNESLPTTGLCLLFPGEGGFQCYSGMEYWTSESRMKQCYCYWSFVSLIWIALRPSRKEQAVNIVRQERVYLEASTVPSMDPGGFFLSCEHHDNSVCIFLLLLSHLPTQQNPSASLTGGLPSPSV